VCGADERVAPRGTVDADRVTGRQRSCCALWIAGRSKPHRDRRSAGIHALRGSRAKKKIAKVVARFGIARAITPQR
jgi:hypothetical protein